MIKSVTTSSSHMYAGLGGSIPYIPHNPSNPSQGMLRINGSDMEVFDGNSWQMIYMANIDVGLNKSAHDAISWAIKKMEQEQSRYKLATNNEAVRIALENLEQAKTRLELTAHLTRDYEEQTTS
jgi:hypothetical protein